MERKYKAKKSPLKRKPRRNPGQSLDEEMSKILYDKIIPYLVVSTLFVFWAIQEWMKWYFKLPPSPILASVMALAVIIFCAIKISKNMKNMKNIKQGRDGEKAVGQYLEDTKKDGTRVFHDIPGENFNIDHLLVSKKGIFVIETKTYSKPSKGKTEIFFDGKDISINGKVYNDNIVTQVTAASKWTFKLIKKLTGQSFPVHPVVLFPGWYVKMTKEYQSDILVLNPKNLYKFIDKMSDNISEQDVKIISMHISKYISSYGNEK